MTIDASKGRKDVPAAFWTFFEPVGVFALWGVAFRTIVPLLQVRFALQQFILRLVVAHHEEKVAKRRRTGIAVLN